MSHESGSAAFPSRQDFDPTGDCLDANHAWEMFGGLTIDQASLKFLEHPQYYQEDFMFMGGVAFRYYFPVLDRYIRDVKIDPKLDDEAEALWILGYAIKAQLEPDNVALVEPIIHGIHDLTRHVRGNLFDYGAEQEDRDRIDSSWAELAETLSTLSKAG